MSLPDANQIEKALEVYYQIKLSDQNPRVTDVERLQNGIGNLMYAYRLDCQGSGEIHPEELILRMSDNYPSKQREFQALNKLKSTGIPVPTVYDLGKDMLGLSFIIMEKVEGENMPILKIDTMTEAELSGVWKQFASILADIHRLDWRKAGLEFLEPPKGKYDYIDQMLSIIKTRFDEWKGGYIKRLLSRFKKKRETIGAHALDALFAWLEDHKPPTDDYVLLHGDYYPFNALMHHNKITAIVDWDGVDLGDAAFDLCEIPLVYRYFDPSGQKSKGLVKRFLDDYREATGSGLDNLDYFMTVKALYFISGLLPPSDVDPNWRITILGGCAEVIWEKTGIRILAV